MFFQSRAFLTYDVSIKLKQASLYGRQCIDICDYAIVVVGDSYGDTQNMGASQMHLSYLSAKAKLKPMMILIKTHQEDANVSRQLKEFTRLVEQQANHVYYYDNFTDIEHLLTFAYDSMTESYPKTPSWTKNQDKEGTSKFLTSDVSSKQAPSSMAHEEISGMNEMSETSDTIDDLTESHDLLEQFDIVYTAQAYEGGNLTDVVMSMKLTWEEVLQTLARIPIAFSSNGLQSAINRLIATKAEPDIKNKMPNVHAVSRCQIGQEDIIKLQRSLIAANWIQLTASGSRKSQELWKLTFYAKKILDNNDL